MLGVPMSSVWYLPSKIADGKTVNNHDVRLIRRPPLSEEPNVVQAFARSNEFRSKHADSSHLHALADDFLDRRIKEIGQDRFTLDA